MSSPPSTAPAEPRVVSVLGHPIAGLAPISFLSAGWILLALNVVPWIRDQFAAALLDGLPPGLEDIWPAPPQVVLVALIGLGLMLIGTILLFVWIRSARGFGPLSDRLLSRPESMAGIVLLVCGILGIAILARGTPTLGEAKGQISRGWLWWDSIRSGTFPRWTDLWYGGYPVDQHFPPLAHILQGGLGFLRLSPSAAAKLLVWFARISGAVGFALFCSQVHRDTRAGLIGGLVYALSPVSHGLWMYDGSLPGVVFLGILPWALLASERCATGTGGIRAGASLALAIGGMVMADTAATRLALVLIAAFTVFRAVPTAASRGARAPSVVGLLIGWIGGAILAGCFLYPAFRQAGFVNDAGLAGLRDLRLRLPAAGALWNAVRWTRNGRDYCGWSVVLLAIGGVIVAIRGGWLGGLLDRRPRTAIGPRAIGPIPLAILIALPFVIEPGMARRNELVLVGVMLAAAGAVRRDPARRRGLRRLLYPFAVLLLLLEFAPFSIATTYGVHRGPREAVYAGLAERMPDGRFLELPIDPWGRVIAATWNFAPGRSVASAGGPGIDGVPHAYAFTAALIDTLARALSQPVPPDADLVRWMAFQNIRSVVTSTPKGPVFLQGIEAAGFSADPAVPGYQVGSASAVSILDPAMPAAPGVPVGVRLTATGLPPAASRALARESLAWIRAARPRAVPEARSVVLPNRLRIETPDLGAVTLRIARNAYPATRVLLDGKDWPWRPAPLGGIALDVGSGAHAIEVWGTEDRIRRTCRFAQWGLAGLLFLISIGPRRR